VEIYNRMKIGVTIGGSVVKEDFLFDSADHAMRSVKQRIETINKFIEFSAAPANTPFTYISRDGTHKFTSDWQPGLRENRLLLSQKSNNPYDAIYQLCTTNNGTTGECLGASHAAILWGISQAMGKTAFNNLYGSPANQLNLANFYKKHVKAATASQLYIPGDKIYFLNSNYGDIAQTQALVKYFPTVDIQVPLFTLAGGTTVTKTVAVPNYLYFAGENCFYVGNMDGTANSFAVLTGRTVKHYTLAEMITLLQTEYNYFVDSLIVKLDAERSPDYTHTGSNTPQFIDKSHKPSPRTVLFKHIGTANIGDITKSEHERPMYNPQP
jgi:hypothetical protein